MFNSENLYNMLKPASNRNLITAYDVYVGGTMLPINYSKGAVIIYTLNSNDQTSQNKDMFNLVNSKEVGSSRIGITYQIDVYKKNAKNLTYIEAEKEAIKIKEWLKSFEIEEYLATLESEILTPYSGLRYLPNEEINKEFINRVSFDFTIITTSEIFESVNIIDKVIFDKTIILQGETTHE